MNGTKIIVFGVAIAVCSLAISTTNVIGIGGGCLGLLIAIVGLCKKD